MPKTKITSAPFKRMIQIVRGYHRRSIKGWHEVWHDTYNDNDIKGKSDKDVEDLILRQDIRWAIDDFAHLHKDNPKKIDQLFINIYLQITGSDLASEEFETKFNLLPIIFPRK